MIYVLDTNIYIDFYERYYCHEVFPSFWTHFTDIINSGKVVIPQVVLNEQFQGEWFTDWLKHNFGGSVLNHKKYDAQWSGVINYIHESDLYKDLALLSEGGWAHDRIADPWLIAIAKEEGFTVVSDEKKNVNLHTHKPHKAAKIPDVCEGLGVRCIDRITFFKEIGLKV